MEIYLVRHGEQRIYEMEWSIDLLNPYVTGEKEVGLTNKGQRDAHQVADFFGQHKIQAVYASDTLRTRETAVYTAEAVDKSVRVLPDLGEINPGRMRPDSSLKYFLSLVSSGKVQRYTPEFAYKFGADGVKGAVASKYLFDWMRGKTEGGENIADVLERIEWALMTMVRDNRPDGGPVVAFCHGYFILFTAITLFFRDKRNLLPYMRQWIVRSGSITHLNYLTEEQTLRLISFARTDHLNPGVA